MIRFHALLTTTLLLLVTTPVLAVPVSPGDLVGEHTVTHASAFEGDDCFVGPNSAAVKTGTQIRLEEAKFDQLGSTCRVIAAPAFDLLSSACAGDSDCAAQESVASLVSPTNVAGGSACSGSAAVESRIATKGWDDWHEITFVTERAYYNFGCDDGHALITSHDGTCGWTWIAEEYGGWHRYDCADTLETAPPTGAASGVVAGFYCTNNGFPSYCADNHAWDHHLYTRVVARNDGSVWCVYEWWGYVPAGFYPNLRCEYV